ncbi:MAG: hypothetical protein AW09_001810 [Candidatus Accumulibacter phosphatis]|uniref:Filamentous haemagglutinin FhaB/tRNA nuclease CdiA-like TPS domain-containing protein n=1 Tax=Candidatus Accumulibacter phosphatis TaxID=327160 RepID=A0A080M776_9PROT|nr:MAG: hypothetical protein AW09_001810 [Candidatus Accumulibacter phosphatis]
MTGKSWRRSLYLARVLLTVALLSMTTHGYGGAGIATDGSVGARQTIAGANAGAGRFVIPQTLGSVVGNNLFHSFSKFNIDTGQTADFTTSTAALAHVISRVSGGSLSQINGTLKLTAAAGSAPAFFFINPAGIVFGAGAALSVPGAFHVSTADYVKFANGDKFHADLGRASTLSSAAPAAFGFLGGTSAPVIVKDGAIVEAQPSQPISVVAGDIEVSNDSVVLTQGGDIRVVAVGNAAQEIGLTGTLAMASGNLAILKGGLIESFVVGGVDGGAVAMSAGNITFDSQGSSGATGIFSQVSRGSSGISGSIEVLATGNFSLVNGGVIFSSTDSSSNASMVKVSAASISVDGRGSSSATGIFSQALSGTGSAGSLEVAAQGGMLSVVNGGQIVSDTYSSGHAGTIGVSAGSIALDNGGIISSTTFSSGNAGIVKVGAGNISIDKQGGSVTGIISRAESGSTGNAGSVEVSTTEILSIVNGGQVSASTYGPGDAGTVKVNAGSIAIDGRNSRFATGIDSNASSGSMGNAGSVDVSAVGALSVVNGGEISSNTSSKGNAGTVRVGAGSIAIGSQASGSGGRISSYAFDGPTGNAGNIEVSTTGNLAIVNGGAIASSTRSSSGNAGTVKVSAGSIVIDSSGPLGQGFSRSTAGIFSDAVAGTGKAGSVEVSATGNIFLVNRGSISSSTSSFGDAGTVKVSAGGMAAASGAGIFSQAEDGTGNAGNVDVSVTGKLSIDPGGVISSTTFSYGNAGMVRVRAGSISIDGLESDNATGIISNANRGSTGNAGGVEVSASGDLSLVNGGKVSSNTSSPGHAGSVEVSVTGNLSFVSGGLLSSSTISGGDGGTVKVRAGSIDIDGGSIDIDGQGGRLVTGIATFSVPMSGATRNSGNAGNIDVAVTDHLAVVNSEITSSTQSAGNAGTVTVRAGSISIVNHGSISSDAVPGSTGNAGTVNVSAGSITIDNGGIISSDTFPRSLGNAGKVEVSASRALAIVNGGKISSGTSALGDAGTVKVSAGSITIIGSQESSDTGIFSSAKPGSTGNAGSVDVTAAGDLSLVNGGAIDSSTFSSGSAGSVTVHSSSLRLDGRAGNGNSSQISAAALENSSGQTGSVTVTANDLTLSNGGQITIENRARVKDPSALTPTSLTVTAPRITLLNSPHAITTESTGNVAAGNIRITASDQLQLDPSGITTTAFEGNGGAIDITAGLLRLDHSQITTSVTGSDNGNGGNIRITADSLILNTGFIQANTKAANSSGGDVSITAQNLVASGNTLFLGESTIHTFQSGVFGINVIQAAAPTGISGTVQISTPKLDVTTSLVGLDTRLINAQVARRLCENTRGSSLVPVGRGGLPPGGADYLSPGQISGIGFVTSPTVSLPSRHASWPNPFSPCLAL